MSITPFYLDEKTIAEKIKTGDKTIFEWLFKSKYAHLCFYATKILGNTSQAEEIVAEAFADLWEKKDKIIFSTSVTAYLFTTVRNKCINHLKHAKVSSTYKKYFLEHFKHFDTQDLPDKIFDEKHLTNEIEKAINDLPDKCKEIFCLSRFENKKYNEIADMLHISPKTVENQMGIALKKLADSLKHLMMFLILTFF
jgi:RNA polymerase sigma-70 factor (ECF subfamily)